ncbi:MAG: DUF1289 domain-containing protein [Methyloversatilis sp. 12-65-5]|nr:MAG: DUF1289 domain-containing protein [Methyloversatilis sp. 12-65-5]
MIASPCTGVCQIDAVSALCLGCLRSREEIACWGSTTDRNRLQILASIARREAAGHVRVTQTDGS